MEEEQKQDYREHLINTIDMLIDSGISVYDLDVVNKKAIRHNYILKQKVIDRINYYDERIKHAKQIRDKEQEEFYIDLKRAFYKLLEEK